jgi:hypothetical protein
MGLNSPISVTIRTEIQDQSRKFMRAVSARLSEGGSLG